MIDMSLQTLTSSANGIPTGFGLRLKEERKRLKLSQADLAKVGGVGRIAQHQYESETTAPTTRYLSAISAAGIDLAYLVLGTRSETGGLTWEQRDRVEEKAFEWVEIFAQSQKDKRLDAKSMRLAYQIFRGFWIQVELGKLPSNLDPKMLMPQIANVSKD